MLTAGMKKRSVRDLLGLLEAESATSSASAGSYPSFSIVWVPIPVLTFFLPFIGHVGICSSNGTSFDMGGLGINEGELLFGHPTRCLQLEPRASSRLFSSASSPAEPTSQSAPSISGQDPESGGQPPGSGANTAGAAAAAPCAALFAWDVDLGTVGLAWDAHLRQAASIYRGKWFNVLTCNCHSFVCDFLNTIGYEGSSSWNMVNLATLIFLRAKYTSWGGVAYTWLPFCTLMTLGAYAGRLRFVYMYALAAGSLVLWFLVYVLLCQGSGNRGRRGSDNALPS